MLLKENPKAVDQAQARGSRVLILAWSQSAVDTETMSLPNDVEGLTLLEIADPIREDAAETLEYLRSEDVTLKIISGDNPVTVSHIAHSRLVLRIIKAILTVLRSVMRSWRLWLKIRQSLAAYLHIRRSC